VNVNINQPAVISAVMNTTSVTCHNGTNGSASAVVAGGTPIYTYAWIPSGGTGATANNLAAGSYTVHVLDSHQCPQDFVCSVAQPTAISFSVSGTHTLCVGEHTLLTASASGGTPSYSYAWLPAHTGSTFSVSPTSNTIYTVTVTDANNCPGPSVQTFSVLVMPTPVAHFDTASTGYSSSIYSFHDQSSGGSSWSWNFGDGTATSNLQSPVHTFPGSGLYTVTQIVYNQFGCPDTFKITVKVGEGILIPNVFTPDGDGMNDVWYIPNSGMKEFHVEIYDRWGAKVFETTADEIRWDGRSLGGKLLSDGTYYYVLHAILKSGNTGKDYSTSGYVTLLTGRRTQ